MEGEHAKDVLQVGDSITVPDQVFAQVTSYNKEFSECAGEEGVLGLGFSDRSSFDFPTPLSHFKTLLKNPMFSLYLDDTDDYEKIPDNYNDDNNNSSSNINGKNVTVSNVTVPVPYSQQKQVSARPISANSEIVFGGVNYKHYDGCLTWHDMGRMADEFNGDEFKGYWDFKLDSVKVDGSTTLPISDVAIIDSGSTFLIGPTDAIAVYAEMNEVMCFDLTDYDDPKAVSCSNELGFDAAVIDCEAPMLNLEFTADGVTYSLGKEDLMVQIETNDGPICILRMTGIDDMKGWILGDAFLNQHYAVFDFGNERIGLAKRAPKNSGGNCQADWPIDIANMDGKATPPAGSGHTWDGSGYVWGGGGSSTKSSNGTPISSSFSPSKEEGRGKYTDVYVAVTVVSIFVVAVIAMAIRKRRRKRRYQQPRADEFDHEHSLGFTLELPNIE